MGRVLNLVLYLQEQQATKLKNEKLKIAMLKLKEASVQKVGYIADLDVSTACILHRTVVYSNYYFGYT